MFELNKLFIYTAPTLVIVLHFSRKVGGPVRDVSLPESYPPRLTRSPSRDRSASALTFGLVLTQFNPEARELYGTPHLSNHTALHFSSLGRNMRRLGANPRRSIHIHAVRARARRDPRRNPLGRKAILLKLLDIPRVQARRADQHPTADLERAVDGPRLRRRLRTTGREPVHRVHEDGDGEGLGLHAGEDFGQLVRVDADVVEGAGLRELGVRFRGQVGGVAAAGVLA